MTAISTNYRTLRPDEIAAVAQECGNAWQDPIIPRRQYELAVKSELTAMWAHKPCAAFSVLANTLNQLPKEFLLQHPRLLDIGASSGYYKEVLEHFGFTFHYTGLDFSPAFATLANELYPGIDFHVADAGALPFPDNAYPLVLSGACLMHCVNWQSALAEAARVAEKYVVFHRTPVCLHCPTSAYRKEGYGVPMLEIHFNEKDFMQECAKSGLDLMYQAEVFWDVMEGQGHRTYLFRKQSEGEREWERA